MGKFSWLPGFGKQRRPEPTTSAPAAKPTSVPVAEALEDRRLFAASITKFQFVLVGTDIDANQNNNSRVFQQVSAGTNDVVNIHVGAFRSTRTRRLPSFDVQVDTNLPSTQATTVRFDLVGGTKNIRNRVEKVKPYSVSGGRPVDRFDPSQGTVPYLGIKFVTSNTTVYTVTARLAGQSRVQLKFRIVE